MAGEDDDVGGEVIVSLPGDTSTVTVVKAEDVVAKTPAGGAADEDPVADLKNQFAQMTGRLSSVQAENQQTRQELQETQQRLHAAEGQVVSSQLDTVLSGLAAAEAETSAAEQAYAQAFDAGDGLAMARAQRAIASAEARKVRLVEAKDDLEEAAKRGPVRQQPTRQQPSQRQPAADPVERFTAGMSPRSAAWIKSHPECVTDPKLNARMLAAHNLAIADDVAVDTDEYFERIEAGIKPASQRKTDPKPGAGDGRRPSSAAASGSGTGGGLNGGGVEVRLTKGEARSATDGTLVWNYPDPSGQNRWQKGDPIGLAEMARRKLEGQKSGLYDKSLTE